LDWTLVKYACTYNVEDTLAKSNPRPSWLLQSPYLTGMEQECKADVVELRVSMGGGWVTLPGGGA
jgi:hypothetical protein